MNWKVHPGVRAGVPSVFGEAPHVSSGDTPLEILHTKT